MRISDWSSDVCSSDLAWPLAADQRAISLPLPPAQTPLMLRQTGGEGPWATVSVSAAVPLTRPLAAGYQVKRKVSVVSQRPKGVLTRGDVRSEARRVGKEGGRTVRSRLERVPKKKKKTNLTPNK